MPKTTFPDPSRYPIRLPAICILLSLCFLGCAAPTRQPEVIYIVATAEPAHVVVPTADSASSDLPAIHAALPGAAFPDTFSYRYDPFENLSVDALSERPYGGSGIAVGEAIYQEEAFTKYEMAYASDGLRITGLIDIPRGDGPFPVVIVAHGYLMPSEYQPGFDSWRYADWIARKGYIAIMPDYRNYGGSDTGPNPFHLGYAIDVMNLIAQLDSLPQAIPEQIGLIGHSMGGEISMYPMVISQEVDAVVLYASMSGDAARNWAHAHRHWPIQRSAMDATALIYGTPEQRPEAYAAISPVNYLDRVRMPVMIHHGTHDESVPYWWSEELWKQMQEAGIDVTFWPYPRGKHVVNIDVMMQRNYQFFETHVRGDVNSPD